MNGWPAFLFVLLCIQFSGLSVESMNHNYHLEIERAEKSLMDGELKTGIQQYIQISETHKDIFIYDFLLPIQVAIKEGSKDTFQLLINKLELTEGLKESMNAKFEKRFKNWDNTWYQLLVAKENYTLKNDYYALIDSLFDSDQTERSKVYGTFFLIRKKAFNEWDQNSFERIQLFTETVKAGGFPSENQMGIDTDFFYHKKLMVIFYHFPETYSRFKPFFDNWLASGMLHPRHYAWIVDFEKRHKTRKRQRKNYFEYAVFAEVDKAFDLSKMTNDQLDEVNMNRKKIGLPSVEHDLKLADFILRNRFFKPAFL